MTPVFIGILAFALILLALYAIGKRPLGVPEFAILPVGESDQNRLDKFNGLQISQVEYEGQTAYERALDTEAYQDDLPWLQSRHWNALAEEMRAKEAPRVRDLGSKAVRKHARRLRVIDQG